MDEEILSYEPANLETDGKTYGKVIDGMLVKMTSPVFINGIKYEANSTDPIVVAYRQSHGFKEVVVTDGGRHTLELEIKEGTAIDHPDHVELHYEWSANSTNELAISRELADTNIFSSTPNFYKTSILDKLLRLVRIK